MSQINGWYGWAMWIPAITTCACSFIVIAYWYYERAIPQKYSPRNGSDVRAAFKFGNGRFAVRNILQLYAQHLLGSKPR